MRLGRDEAALLDPALTRKTAQNYTDYLQPATRRLAGAIRSDKLATIRKFANEIYLSLLKFGADLSTRISIIIVPIATSIYSQMLHNKYKE
jgi:hypothetical protein